MSEQVIQHMSIQRPAEAVPVSFRPGYCDCWPATAFFFGFLRWQWKKNMLPSFHSTQEATPLPSKVMAIHLRFVTFMLPTWVKR